MFWANSTASGTYQSSAGHSDLRVRATAYSCIATSRLDKNLLCEVGR